MPTLFSWNNSPFPGHANCRDSAAKGWVYHMNRRIGAVALLAFMVTVVGCARAPQQRPGEIGGGGGRNTATGNDLGSRVSAYVATLPEVTSQVSKQAAVSSFILGNVAFVGIDSSDTTGQGTGNANQPGGGARLTGQGQPGTGTNTPGGGGTGVTGLSQRVSEAIRSRFPEIGDAYVTTDQNLATRIAQIASEIKAGQSSAGRLPEMFSIARAMVPTEMMPTGAGR